MRPRSALWDARIIQSHTIVVRADIVYDGVVVAEDLAVVGGEVILDRTAAVRGRCKVDLAEPLMVPNGAGDPLSPYGYEIRLQRGIVYADGTSELMPLGIFGIQKSLVDSNGLISKIDGLDRAQKVADARLEDDYAIASGTNVGTAIQAVLLAAMPSLTFSFASTSYTTPALVLAVESDPWAKALDMARSVGYELFLDGDGVCVFRAEPTVSVAPDWSVVEGENGVLVEAALALDRGPAYNRVIASSTSMGAAAQYRGTATDDTPSSPTYYYGPFGKKPRFYGSPLLASSAQCTAAATGILAGNIGVAKSITFGAVPNPAVEPGDSVLVTRSALGVDEIHMVDVVRIPLTATGVMSAETRQIAA